MLNIAGNNFLSEILRDCYSTASSVAVYISKDIYAKFVFLTFSRRCWNFLFIPSEMKFYHDVSSVELFSSVVLDDGETIFSFF